MNYSELWALLRCRIEEGDSRERAAFETDNQTIGNLSLTGLAAGKGS
jgi:hypothetical protein